MGGHLSGPCFELEADDRAGSVVDGLHQSELHQAHDIATDGAVTDLPLALSAPLPALHHWAELHVLAALGTDQQPAEEHRQALLQIRSEAEVLAFACSREHAKQSPLCEHNNRGHLHGRPGRVASSPLLRKNVRVTGFVSTELWKPQGLAGLWGFPFGSYCCRRDKLIGLYRPLDVVSRSIKTVRQLAESTASDRRPSPQESRAGVGPCP